MEVLSTFTEVQKVTDFLAEVIMEPGVFFIIGDLNGPSLCCEAFALPFDSSQDLNLASMSTLAFGVSSL